MIFLFKDQYHFLSNFYLCKVYNEFDNQNYPSVEHAYQSLKCDLIEWKELCRCDEAHPGLIKKKSREIDTIKDWDSKKVNYMYRLVSSKFFNNKELWQKLYDTGNQNIVEGNYHHDTFWGVDLMNTPNIGENHLGRILMNVRSQLGSPNFCS